MLLESFQKNMSFYQENYRYVKSKNVIFYRNAHVSENTTIYKLLA